MSNEQTDPAPCDKCCGNGEDFVRGVCNACNGSGSEYVAEVVARIRAELHHAQDNGHTLQGQGIGPGERVPGVRISNIEAVLDAPSTWPVGTQPGIRSNNMSAEGLLAALIAALRDQAEGVGMNVMYAPYVDDDDPSDTIIDGRVNLLRLASDIESNAEQAKGRVSKVIRDRLDAQAATIQRATQLIADLTDPATCEFDHHGGCQAHGYLSLQPGETCPQADAAEWDTK